MNYQDAFNKYKNTHINTADGGKLVVLLYEGALSAIDVAIKRMDYKNYDIVNEQIKKATDIINELLVSLDMDVGEISERLQSIYLYILKRLNQANMDKSVEKLKEAKVLLEELLIAWKAISNGDDSTDNDGFPPPFLSSGVSIKG